MKIGRIFNKIARNIEIRKYEKTQAEINRYVKMPNLWEVPDSVDKPMADVFRFREHLAKIAKEDRFTISMKVVTPDESQVPRLDITMTDISKKKGAPAKSAVRHLDIDDSQPLVYSKSNHRMLEDKDGLNYEAIGTLEYHEVR